MIRRELIERLDAMTKERDDLGQACAELERRVQEDYAKSIIADQETRIAELEAQVAASRVRSDAGLTANDLYYLKSILGHLRELKSVLPDETAFTLGGEAFHDLDWLDCFIDKHERLALAAKAAEGETVCPDCGASGMGSVRKEPADPRTTLHTVISDIREASGLGGRPMLGELAGEIGKLRERADQVAALTKERDEVRASRDRVIRIEGVLQRDLHKAQTLLCAKFAECGDKQGDGCTCFPGDGPFANAVPPNVRAERAEAALAARPAAGAVGEEEIARAIRSANGEDWAGWPYVNEASREQYLRQAHAVLALLHASPSGEGWHPIETAPKDGTQFLAADADGEIGIISRHDPGGATRNPKHHYECWVTDFNSPMGEPPTHWRPLPSPPTESER